MIISIDAEKDFDKIQHPFMIKTLKKVAIEGPCLNITKVIYDKPTAHTGISGGKADSISSKIRNKTRMSTLTTFIQHRCGSPSHGNQRRKINKKDPIWKEVKLSLYTDDMILYIEDPKDATRKLPELINEFGKVSGYKINTQKSLASLYTNNKRSEREIKETIPFTITSKRIKYLDINLPKDIRDLYSENYTMLMKEIKDDTNRWRDIPCSGLEESTL